MAGFFGIGNFTKPGPGVSKDEPQKFAFFRFFELYFRKFWKLIELNLLYVVCCIPFFIPLFIAGMYTKNTVVLNLLLIPAIGIAMITSGFTYVLRNFAREMPTFLWSDFKDAIINNWRQSVVIGVIDTAAYFLMYFSISFYNMQTKANSLYIIPLILCLFVSLVFIFMQYYLFVMLVTFDLTIKQLFKNALIFAFAGLVRNILISIFVGIIVLFIYMFLPLSLVLVLLLALSTIGFIINFTAWPLVNKYMIPNEAVDTEKSVFEDNGNEKKK